MNYNRSIAVVGLFALVLAGCTPLADFTDRATAPNQEAVPNPGACMVTDQTPAIIETRIEDILVTPAVIGDGGTIIEPAVFRTQTRQTIVQERRDVRFETPCPPVMDQPFLASLQRALKARGHYQGEINATMDGATQKAIRSFQAESGLNSAILSTTTARRLGLLV